MQRMGIDAARPGKEMPLDGARMDESLPNEVKHWRGVWGIFASNTAPNGVLHI